MNLKRGLIFGLLLWMIVFIIISILIMLPWVKDSSVRINVLWYIFEIPVILLLAKLYFKQKKPTLKEGFMLGVLALVIGIILDVIITVPLFIGGDYAKFYGDWMLYIGFAELIILTTISGWEFDGPVARTEPVANIDKKEEK